MYLFEFAFDSNTGEGGTPWRYVTPNPYSCRRPDISFVPLLPCDYPLKIFLFHRVLLCPGSTRLTIGTPTHRGIVGTRNVDVCPVCRTLALVHCYLRVTRCVVGLT